jgi:recombination protein RecA
MTDVLKDLRNKLQKAVKGVHIEILANSDLAKREIVPTPAYDINRILSGKYRGGGVYTKTINLIVGPEATGKSSLSVLGLLNAHKKGFKAIIIDTEGAYTPEFVQRWGLDPGEVLLIYTPFVEDIQVLIGNLLDSGEEQIVLILDSIGGIARKSLQDQAIAGDVKADQGLLQKDIKALMKLCVYLIKSRNSLMFTTGHFYGKPTQYGSPEEIGGGKYPRLAADTIISLKKSPLYRGKEKEREIIGSQISAICLKNRFYPPFQEAIIEIDYNKGISPHAGLIETAMEAGIIIKNGAWYKNTITGENTQGANNLVLGDKCIDELEKFLATTGYSTVNEEIAIEMKHIAEDEESLEDN